LRHSSTALRRGTYHRLFAADGVYAFGRKLNDEKLVIALNAAEQVRTLDVVVDTLALLDGALSTIFGEAKAKVQGGKIVGLKLAPRSAAVLKGKK
jgi:glycosidase